MKKILLLVTMLIPVSLFSSEASVSTVCSYEMKKNLIGVEEGRTALVCKAISPEGKVWDKWPNSTTEANSKNTVGGIKVRPCIGYDVDNDRPCYAVCMSEKGFDFKGNEDCSTAFSLSSDKKEEYKKSSLACLEVCSKEKAYLKALSSYAEFKPSTNKMQDAVINKVMCQCNKEQKGSLSYYSLTCDITTKNKTKSLYLVDLNDDSKCCAARNKVYADLSKLDYLKGKVEGGNCSAEITDSKIVGTISDKYNGYMSDLQDARTKEVFAQKIKSLKDITDRI